jgi:hypothetical protein
MDRLVETDSLIGCEQNDVKDMAYPLLMIKAHSPKPTLFCMAVVSITDVSTKEYRLEIRHTQVRKFHIRTKMLPISSQFWDRSPVVNTD